MNYTLDYIHVKTNWLDGIENKYKSIGYDGFALYLDLFRFRIHNNDPQHTFYTSLAQLRKVSGYSTEKVYELIRRLVKYKVITTNVTRWERMLNDQGKVIDDRLLIINTLDYPLFKIARGKKVPLTVDDNNVDINLTMIQHYKDEGLGERSFGLYFLIKYMSVINSEEKCWMSINKMADILGFGDNNINKMIRLLNEKYLLASYYHKKKEGGEKWEHYLLFKVEWKEEWMKVHKNEIDKNIKKWNKSKAAK